MRANGWESPSVLRRAGSSASVFRLGHFRYERPWLKDERRRSSKYLNSNSESDTANSHMQSVEWGWRGHIPRTRGIYRPTRGEETSSPQEE
jgi:hypothetical protein